MFPVPAAQGGNALFLILIAVALFAALSYAVTQSGRGAGGIAREQAMLDGGVNSQCIALVESAAMRLQLLDNCAPAQVSYELQDGSNANPLSPPDKSCHLFAPQGAGLTPCGIYKTGGHPCMAELALGESCNNVIYAGTSGGNRLYTLSANQHHGSWGNNTTTGATSAGDGLENRAKIESTTNGNAASVCAALGPKWYLPARDELNALYNNRNAGLLAGTFPGTWYWSSTEVNGPTARYRNFSDGVQAGANKYNSGHFRCVRRD